MTFCIVTHVLHTQKNNEYYSYSPYVSEMNIWLKYVDKVIIIAPIKNLNIDSIHQKYNHSNINFIQVPEFSLTSVSQIIRSFFVVPVIFFKIIKVMLFANHIHLRCPGNMGLLGSIAQIFFPLKSKSVKYAGNWDPNSKQPNSYKIQKWILRNTSLTHNCKILVYGEWKNQTKNVKPFFTATYNKSEIKEIPSKEIKGKLRLLFVGTLSKGKQPLYAINIAEKLKLSNYDVELFLYGEGGEKVALEKYIKENKLSQFIYLMGNTDRESMKEIYQSSHFLVLPSKSEGWPKVVAEAMFWGCLPIVTPISCVPNMLNFGERGILLTENLQTDVTSISDLLSNQEEYNKKIKGAINWSRQFTIDKFEQEIKKILKT
jgi:glycosyltransferase involved in cell wall biosynthesis